MGNDNSSTETIQKEFLSKYTYENELKSKQMMTSKIYFNKINKEEKILLIEKQFYLKNEFDNYLYNLKCLSGFINKYVCKYEIITSNIDSNICQDIYKSLISCEYYNNNLYTEINKRKIIMETENVLFSEDEIWYILKSISNFSYDLMNLSFYHKDIQPKNIFINKDGEIKIFFSCYFFGYESNYNHMLENKFNIGALSPDQVKGIKKYKMKIDENLEKSESFSIGITILSIMSLTNIKNFYDFNNDEIDFYKIKKKITFCQNNKFSKQLIQLVESLLRIRENERIGLKELNNELLKKQINISKLKNCTWM